MIASSQIASTEIFAFLDVLVFKVLLTLQLGISKMLKNPYFNVFGKTTDFFISLTFR